MKFKVRGAHESGFYTSNTNLHFPSPVKEASKFNVMSKNSNGFTQVVRKSLPQNVALKVVEYLQKTGSKNNFYIEKVL